MIDKDTRQRWADEDKRRKLHEWPTGCLVFDENENNNPVNARKVQVVPLLWYEGAQAIAGALYRALNLQRAKPDSREAELHTNRAIEIYEAWKRERP